MLTIEHHIVKSGEAHDLDQCRVARETLHTQRDLTLIDHFLYAVLLVHRSTSLSDRETLLVEEHFRFQTRRLVLPLNFKGLQDRNGSLLFESSPHQRHPTNKLAQSHFASRPEGQQR